MPGRVLSVRIGSIPTGPSSLAGSLSESLGLVDAVSPSLVVAGGMPTAATTGPAAGVTLDTVSGDLVLGDGDQVSGRHVTGDLILAGSDCSATDCLVDGGIWASTSAAFGATTGARQTVTRCKAAYLGNIGGLHDVTVDACYIGGDGLDQTASQLVDGSGAANVASGLTVRGSIFYGRPHYTSGDPHWEAAHWAGITGLSITGTVFDFAARDGDSATQSHITACVTFENSWVTGTQCQGDFSGNWLFGGGYYQAYLNLVGGTVDDNAFHSDAGASPYTIAIANPGFTASGNTLDGNPLTVSY